MPPRCAESSALVHPSANVSSFPTVEVQILCSSPSPFGLILPRASPRSKWCCGELRRPRCFDQGQDALSLADRLTYTAFPFLPRPQPPMSAVERQMPNARLSMYGGERPLQVSRLALRVSIPLIAVVGLVRLMPVFCYRTGDCHCRCGRAHTRTPGATTPLGIRHRSFRME